jgi:MerR family copper efflux transcriptional regulator
MLIGELATRAGVTPKTVRYYERLGFIKASRRSSGYRDFDDASLDVIQTIRSAKRLGIKLSEMDEIIALIRDRQLPCASVQRVINAKRREVAEQIAALRDFDEFLARLQDVSDSDGAPCPILATARREAP